jgi:hypothetical protein
MNSLRILLSVLAILLASTSCDQRAYYPTEGTGPSSASGEEAAGPAYQEPTTTYKAIRPTHLCRRRTDVFILLRDRTPEDEATFQDRLRTGRIVPLDTGTEVQIDSGDLIGVTMLNGREEKFRRGTILGGDDAGVRGLIPANDLAPAR